MISVEGRERRDEAICDAERIGGCVVVVGLRLGEVVLFELTLLAAPVARVGVSIVTEFAGVLDVVAAGAGVRKSCVVATAGR